MKRQDCKKNFQKYYLNCFINNDGFTLLELLITVSIILTMSTMALFSFRGAGGRAKDAKLLADMSVLRSALSVYAVFESQYPVFSGVQTWAELFKIVKSSDKIAIGISEALPQEGGVYCYYVKRDGSEYVLVGSPLRYPGNFGAGYSQDILVLDDFWQFVKYPSASSDPACPAPAIAPSPSAYIPCSQDEVYCVKQ